MARSPCRSFFTALRRASRAIPETPIARETTPTLIPRTNPVLTSSPELPATAARNPPATPTPSKMEPAIVTFRCLR